MPSLEDVKNFSSIKLRLLSFLLAVSLSANGEKLPAKLAHAAVGASLAVLAAAKVADYQTSVDCHCYESNPLFQTHTGRYDAPKALGVNLAVFGGIAAFELVWMHKHPTSPLLVSFAAFNSTVAVGTAHVAYRNSQIQPIPATLK
jgi:hypothetical protein